MGTNRVGPEEGPVVSLEDYKRDHRASPFHGADVPHQGKDSRNRTQDRERYAHNFDRIDWSDDGKDSDEGSKRTAEEAEAPTKGADPSCSRCDGWGCRFCRVPGGP